MRYLVSVMGLFGSASNWNTTRNRPAPGGLKDEAHSVSRVWSMPHANPMPLVLVR